MNVRPKKVDPWLGFEKGAPAHNYSIGKENFEQSVKVIPCSSMLDWDGQTKHRPCRI